MNANILPHESGNVGLPCVGGHVLCFARTGNGVWQACRGDLFATVRVCASKRTSPPHLHFFDELIVEKINGAAEYLGSKIDWGAIRPTNYIVVQGDGEIRRVVSNGIIGDGFRMAFDSWQAAEQAMVDFQEFCKREAAREGRRDAGRQMLKILPSPEADDFGVDVAMAKLMDRDGACYAVVAN